MALGTFFSLYTNAVIWLFRFKEVPVIHKEVSRLVRIHPTAVSDIPEAIQVWWCQTSYTTFIRGHKFLTIKEYYSCPQLALSC